MLMLTVVLNHAAWLAPTVEHQRRLSPAGTYGRRGRESGQRQGKIGLTGAHSIGACFRDSWIGTPHAIYRA